MNRVTGFSPGRGAGQAAAALADPAGRARHRPRAQAGGGQRHARPPARCGCPRWAAPCCAPPSTWWRCAGQGGHAGRRAGHRAGRDRPAPAAEPGHPRREAGHPRPDRRRRGPRDQQPAHLGPGLRRHRGRARRSLALEGKGPTAFDATDLDRLRKIEEGAERIRRFARDLVSYARPSGSEVEEIARQRGARPGAVVLRARARERRTPSSSATTPTACRRVQAVRDQILQVAINLVTNAAHAVEPARRHGPGAHLGRRRGHGRLRHLRHRRRHQGRGPPQDLRAVLHHQAGRARAPASGSRWCATSSIPTAARSAFRAAPAAVQPSWSRCR